MVGSRRSLTQRVQRDWSFKCRTLLKQPASKALLQTHRHAALVVDAVVVRARVGAKAAVAAMIVIVVPAMPMKMAAKNL